MKGHKERLLKYLQENGKITTMEAIQNLRNKYFWRKMLL